MISFENLGYTRIFLPNIIGGAEVSAFLVVKGLVKQGNEVFVVAEKSSFSINYGNLTMESNNLCGVFRSHVVCPRRKPLWVIEDWGSLFLSFLSILRYIKALRPQVIFTHKNAGLGAIYAAKLLDVPSVYVVRGYQHDCFNKEKILSVHGEVQSCGL